MSAGNFTIGTTEYPDGPMSWEPQHGPRARTFDTLPLSTFTAVSRVYGRERANAPQRYHATWDLMEVAMADRLRVLYEQQQSFTLEYTDVMGRTVDAAIAVDLTGALTEFFGPTYPWKSGTVAVYKNGALQSSGFTLHLDRGSVSFAAPLDPADVVTVLYDWQMTARLDMLRLTPIEIATLYEVESIFAEVP